MKKIAIFALLFLTSGIKALADERPPDPCDGKRIRALVVPFVNETRSRSQAPLSLALAATLSERFDHERSCVAPINGQLILTADQASVTGIDAANALARAKGATHVIVGRYRGSVENWTLAVDLYAVGDQPMLVSSGEASTNLIENPKRPVVSMKRMHAALTIAVSGALSRTCDRRCYAVTPLLKPPTNDAYAFLLLGRAYDRHFRGAAAGDESAIAVAAHAVRVDPTFIEAQRFYASLLEAAGQPRKARIHFEVVLDARPDDVRSLLALGRIEIGQKNPELAETYLKSAAKARPDDPMTHFWLGRAQLLLGRKAEAIAEFERVRDLDPADMDARRELVTLYAADKRYGMASAELGKIVESEPGNKAAAFQLAACLRAGGMRDQAVASYKEAASRFPSEPRFARFAGDIEAVNELVATVNDGIVVSAAMEESLARSRDALNAAVVDLQADKKKGCETAAAAYALARNAGTEYAELGSRLTRDADAIAAAFKGGDEAALAPDEAGRARMVAEYRLRAERDLRETHALMTRSAVPLMVRYGCPTSGAVPADIAEVRKRNRDRTLAIEPAKPIAGGVISPEVPPDPARIIRFSVKNESDVVYAVTVDGDAERAALVPPGKEITLRAPVGTHRLCVQPQGAACDERTVRTVPLYDQWKMIVKASR
jgi:tetratricopeptide (TPR) repeat protein